MKVGPIASMIRRTVLFSGSVQGVGFRYTTFHLAAGFKVVGYVRNLPDGRVELIVEGAGEEICRFLDAVAAAMAGHIRRTEQHDEQATGEFSRFDVRH